MIVLCPSRRGGGRYTHFCACVPLPEHADLVTTIFSCLANEEHA